MYIRYNTLNKKYKFVTGFTGESDNLCKEGEKVFSVFE